MTDFNPQIDPGGSRGLGFGFYGPGDPFAGVEFAPIPGLDLGFGPGVLPPGVTPPGGGTEPEPEPETPEDRRDRIRRQQEQEERGLLRAQRQRDARQTILKILGDYGLADLGDYVYNEIIVKETVDISNPDAIVYALREQPAYQKRFAANTARAKKGLAELDPASYIGLENAYRTLLQSNGLPANFYDQPDDFQALIEGDVSPSELQTRVEQGYRAVADADPQVVNQMRTLYGVGEGELAAYFLDPTRAAPLLTRQARAAQISARGVEQAGIQLTGALAEDLARRGVTAAEAERGFAEIGAMGELRQQFGGEEAITEEELVMGQLGSDVAAQQRLAARQRRRVAAFEGGGQFARTTGETSGSTRLATGTAE
jgi:hypothetical protein